MNRRAFLVGFGASLGVGAGCVGPGPNDTGRPTPSDGDTPTPTPARSLTEPGRYVRPADGPETVRQPLDCDSDSFERQNGATDGLQWGDAAPFAPRIGSHTYDYGETARITLTNTGETTATSGIKAKHRVEAYTEAGWQPVGGANRGDSLPYYDLGLSHDPGEGLEWGITLTESGLSEPQPAAYRVCPALRTGRYRFVFWGVDDPLAVAFDLRRE